MPLLLLSDLERNVMNQQDDSRCALHFFSTPDTMAQIKKPEYYDVMTKPRSTLMGTLQLVPENELEKAAETYLKKHPSSKAWLSFDDFHMYRFVPDDIYVVGGFGNTHYIGYIAPDQYLSVS